MRIPTVGRFLQTGFVTLGILTTVSFGIRGFILSESKSTDGTRTGEIPPEFAPVSHVVVTDLLIRDYDNPALVSQILGAGAKVLLLSNDLKPGDEAQRWLQEQGFSAAERQAITVVQEPFDTPWIRDYGPMSAIGLRSDGTRGPLLVDFSYTVQSQLDDVIPAPVAKALDLPLKSLPLAVDGGNFLSNGIDCFMAAPARDIPESGEVRSREIARQKDIWQKHYQELGCRKVVFFDHAPHPHIDMWAKIVSRDVVLVSELQKKSLEAVTMPDGFIPEEYLALKQSLDEQAAIFAQTMRVERIPMPLPYRGTFRNYTNALLINGRAIVPHYIKLGYNYDVYPDEHLKESYQRDVYEAYTRAGYQVEWLDADTLIYNGGSFHCVALQVYGTLPVESLSLSSQLASSLKQLSAFLTPRIF